MMQTYPKRRFESVAEMAGEVTFFTENLGYLIGLAMGKGPVSPSFRERIMLAVTSVNNCRYCSFVHTQVSLREGFTPDEIRALLDGSVDDAPEEESEALLFAQHYAETRGNPTPQALEKLVETYGEVNARAIEVAIRAIMFGNYFGNSLDATIYALTRGILAKPDAG